MKRSWDLQPGRGEHLALLAVQIIRFLMITFLLASGNQDIGGQVISLDRLVNTVNYPSVWLFAVFL